MQDTIPCRKAFTQALLEQAKKDKSIMVVTTDARGSVTLNDFAEELPEQFIELGIAEQNAISVGAGLTTTGFKSFVCGPACFLSSRSVEQIKLDVAYSYNNVKIIGVSGGVSYGALGSSHHSLHDIAVMRAFPDLTVILPCDIHQTRKMTAALCNHPGPVYVRMGRGAVPNVYNNGNIPFQIGEANILNDGSDITLIGTGETVYRVKKSAKLLKKDNINARVIDMHTIKPMDEKAVLNAAKQTGAIISVEEHSVLGGLGSAISEILIQNHPVPLRIMGIPDEYAVHGKSEEIFEYYGLTADNIAKEARKLLDKKRKFKVADG
jgi:transketolase